MHSASVGKNNMVLWIVIAFLAGAAVMALLFTVRARGLRSQAYSSYGGGMGWLDQGSQNCFDARLDGPQVMACLGIPSASNGDSSGGFGAYPEYSQ